MSLKNASITPEAPVDVAVEEAIGSLGKHILNHAEQTGTPPFFSTRSLYGKLMEWSLRDPAFKTQLFRFVDVFPALQSSGEVERHFKEYIEPFLDRAPPLLRFGLRASATSSRLLQAGVHANIDGMARLFIIENRPEKLAASLRRLHEQGIGFTVDLLGETVISEKEADAYANECLGLLDRLTGETRRWKGSVEPRVNLSIKVSALYSQIHPADPEGSLIRLKKRLRPILRKAQALGAFINFDMEHYALKDLTISLFQSLLEEEEFQGYPHLGLAIQAYLRDSEADLNQLIQWARRRTQPFTVRLVKGAYWDYEVVIARQKHWPVPVYIQKQETDASFERLSLLLLDHADLVTPAFGSHNVRSLAHAITHAAARGIDKSQFEIQVLHGMAAPLAAALVRLGLRVREYCPTGDLIPGMAYLVRRLLENSSNEGFLASRFTLGQSAETLLQNPAPCNGNGEAKPRLKAIESSLRVQKDGTILSFQNIPHLDFTRQEVRTQFHNGLKRVRASLGQTSPLLINGKRIKTRHTIPSTNPADPSVIIGHASRGGTSEANKAVEAARHAAPAWARVSPSERASILDTAADLMEKQRYELAALEVYEAGKNWIESDADVAEAIDFCRYYAREMRRLAIPVLTQNIPGEENQHHWIPRGTGVVIAPWNFPLAILCGMTAAALVTGNTVIMKPAEQTPILGAWLMELFIEAGIPPGVLNLVTGLGDVGAALASHPGTDFVAFTGSKEVGLKIWETAGKTDPQQSNLKKAIVEMGGKNAMIIDSDADPDEAIPAAIYSAFGYQGQKCSALSRLIILDEVHDAFLQRLVEAATDLPIGNPENPATFIGPMIDENALNKSRHYVEIGKQEAKLVYQGKPPEGRGYYIGPAIFAEVSPTARIAREEIFGPVLSVLRAGTIDEAIRLANDTEFGLTGGIFSRSPKHIEQARNEVMVGNFYINRSITGSIVERQPFGGFFMSGGGSKAGGRDYLKKFMLPRIVTENRLRHGFAPPEDLPEAV